MIIFLAQDRDKDKKSGEPPVIVLKPKAQVVDEGEAVIFQCKITAVPTPEVPFDCFLIFLFSFCATASVVSKSWNHSFIFVDAFIKYLWWPFQLLWYRALYGSFFKISWKKDDVELQSKSGHLKIYVEMDGSAVLSTLSIEDVLVTDSGKFQVVAENDFGIVDAVVSLIVRPSEVKKTVDLKSGLKKSETE